MPPELKHALRPVARRQQRAVLWRTLGVCWAAAAGVTLALVWLQRQSGWTSSLALPGMVLLALVAALVLALRQRRRETDWREVAREIEACHPELDGRLLTAVQQEPQAGTELNYLQRRLLDEVLLLRRQKDWSDAFAGKGSRLAMPAHWLALALFVAVLPGLRTHGSRALLSREFSTGVTVLPGDAALERGSTLVVLARFSGPLPAAVDWVIGRPPGTVQRLPLVKSLADPVFGGTLPDVTSNLSYHVEYAGKQTRDFSVTVFEHPRLERADAGLVFPEYTAQAPQHIENTRRVTAVEGSRLDLTLQLNKPVVSARLVGRGKAGTAIPLLVETNRAAASLKEFPLETNAAYELQLVDAEGRTNKVQSQFVFSVLKNRTPELRLALPRGDVRPSPLEEVSFEGTVWDDFGVHAYGVGYDLVGQETKFIELGREVPAKQKHPFQYLLRLEPLGLEPNQLVSWFVWADDTGPDGKVRRTSGDLFFAEVRPFEEVFREGQGMDGQSQQQGGQAGSQTSRLAELQKQIISATWKLLHRENNPPPSAPKQDDSPGNPSDRATPVPQGTSARERSLPGPRTSELSGSPGIFSGVGFLAALGVEEPAPNAASSAATGPAAPRAADRGASTYESDMEVVRDSQASALEQAQEASHRQRDSRAAALWSNASKEMTKALTRLSRAAQSPGELPEALAAEQAAYQALLRLQEHEYQVNRSRNRGRQGGGQGGQMQRQLEQMDLTQSENRYETQRLAQPPANAQRREQLQVMNRLQELARRQQDLNDRLKELQTALQEARTEREREEIRRRLKRLQEEEQQMLADVDELRQRMDRPENQSSMNDERRQLDQTRDDVQRAAEAASQGAASQALASGTRAQRQFEQLHQEMRQQNSSQFSNDLRDMRNDARELAHQQEELAKQLEAEDSASHKSLSGAPGRQALRDQLARQKQRLTNLVDRATQVSQQAEEAEPLLSRQLYDTVRQFTQDSAKAVNDTRDQLLERRRMNIDLYDKLKDNSQPDGAKLVDLESELLRLGFATEAQETAQRLRSGIDNLKNGVERAAESVLGNEAEALRLAQEQLDQSTDELQKEMAQGGTGQSQTNSAAAQTGRPEGGHRGTPQPLAGNAQAGQRQNAGARAGQRGQDRGQNQPGGRQADSLGANSRAGAATGGAGGDEYGGAYLDRFPNDGALRLAGPITGEDFVPWSERLRDVEELLDQPELRNQVAVARDRVRLMRQEYKRDRKKPDWAVVRLQVMKPLQEVRDRLADELARRQSRDALVPIDRDPVPNRYSELVRRYYEELGKDNGR